MDRDVIINLRYGASERARARKYRLAHSALLLAVAYSLDIHVLERNNVTCSYLIYRVHVHVSSWLINIVRLFCFWFYFKQMVPQNKIRCWERAAKGSFFSRENACNFINFCRQLGIHDNLLFESEDLGMITNLQFLIAYVLYVYHI